MLEVTRKLVDLLDLSPIGDDHFQGDSEDLGFPNVFGGQVLGQALMAASLGAIDAGFEEGAAPLPQVMIGDPDYYDRWGFLADHTGGWHCPGPYDRDRLLARTGNPAVLPAEGMLGPWNS